MKLTDAGLAHVGRLATLRELDISGFADHVSGAWKGEPLWLAFKRWQAGLDGPKSTAVGEKPDLYAH